MFANVISTNKDVLFAASWRKEVTVTTMQSQITNPQI